MKALMGDPVYLLSHTLPRKDAYKLERQLTLIFTLLQSLLNAGSLQEMHIRVDVSYFSASTHWLSPQKDMSH